MKIIITVCIFIAAINSNAQSITDAVNIGPARLPLKYIATNGRWLPVENDINSDTLIISNWQQYKFIKIGDKVYQINSPTISEVQSPITLPFRWGGGTYWPYDGTIPTTTTDILYDSLVLHGDTLRTIKRRK